MAARFDSASDYLAVLASLPPAHQPITCCWRQQIVVARTSTAVVFQLASTGASSYENAGIDSTGTRTRLSSTGAVTGYGSNLVVGNWYSLCYRRDGNTHTLWLRGALDITTTNSTSFTPVFLTIGGQSVDFINGRVQDVGFWNRALSESEIYAQAIAAEGTVVSTTSLYAFWPLTTVSQLTDTSGGGHTLTMGGTVGWDANAPAGSFDPPTPYIYNVLTRSATNPKILNSASTPYDELKAGPRTVIRYDSDVFMLYEGIENDSPTLTTTVNYAYSADNGNTFTKDSGNPVMDATETWEGPEVAPTSMHEDLDTFEYVLYYHGGGNSNPRQIGRAVSWAIGGPWDKDSGNPVFSPGTAGQWDAANVADCKVMKVGSVYHMFYVGDNGPENKIGHATSSDGITWTRDPANPVFVKGAAGQWDSGEVQSPGVMYEGGLFHMWYVGDNGDDAQEKIGYASSPDGTTWTRGPNNPVLVASSPFLIGDTVDVYRAGNTVHVLYGEFNFGASPVVRSISDATVNAPIVRYVFGAAARGSNKATAATVLPGAISVSGITARTRSQAKAAAVTPGIITISAVAARSASRATAATVTAPPITITVATARTRGVAKVATVTSASTVAAAAARGASRATAAAILAGPLSVTAVTARTRSYARVATATGGPVSVAGITARSRSQAYAAALLPGPVAVSGVAARARSRAVAATIQPGDIAAAGIAARSQSRATAATVTNSMTIVAGVAARSTSRATTAIILIGSITQSVAARGIGRATVGTVVPGPVSVFGVKAISVGRALPASVSTTIPAQVVAGVAARSLSRAAVATITPGAVMVVGVAAVSRSRATVANVMEIIPLFVFAVAARSKGQAKVGRIFFSMVAETPPWRTYEVGAELREFYIEAEDREIEARVEEGDPYIQIEYGHGWGTVGR